MDKWIEENKVEDGIGVDELVGTEVELGAAEVVELSTGNVDDGVDETNDEDADRDSDDADETGDEDSDKMDDETGSADEAGSELEARGTDDDGEG